ncbi:MAG: hypothetical protein QOC59_568 [Microbacteriaceae bacterium]|nr:hypothetical protein [Microbacteriaceae bacterium]
MVTAALHPEGRPMSGSARAAAVGVLATILLLGPLAGAALADPPGGTDSPTPTPTATPSQQIDPVPAPPAVTGIRFTPGTDRVTVSWTGSADARSYTVQVESPTAQRGTFDTRSLSLDLPLVPAGSALRVRIVAHGVAADSAAATGSWTRPSTVPRVASAVLTATRIGLRVTWVPAGGTPSGSRYLVRVRGADGTVLARTVAGSAVAFAGVRRDTLYSASVTTEAPGGRRSAAYDLSAVMVRGSVAAQPGGSPLSSSGGAAGEPTRGATAPIVPAVEPRATSTAAAASAPLISSPVVALACAVAAVLLGGSAIIVLLRRRPRR